MQKLKNFPKESDFGKPFRMHGELTYPDVNYNKLLDCLRMMSSICGDLDQTANAPSILAKKGIFSISGGEIVDDICFDGLNSYAKELSYDNHKDSWMNPNGGYNFREFDLSYNSTNTPVPRFILMFKNHYFHIVGSGSHVDDNQDTVLSRLSAYHEQTSPLAEWYDNLGIFHRIDGDRAIDLISTDILEALDN